MTHDDIDSWDIMGGSQYESSIMYKPFRLSQTFRGRQNAAIHSSFLFL